MQMLGIISFAAQPIAHGLHLHYFISGTGQRGAWPSSDNLAS